MVQRAQIHRPPVKPWRVLALVLPRAVTSFVEDGCTQQAAAISYFALFSVFPLALLVAAVFGLVLRDQNLQSRVLESLVAAIPVQAPSVANSLRALADLGPTLSVVGFLAAVWSSSALASAIRAALDIVFVVDQPRPLLRAKLVDYAIVLGAGMLFLASTAVTTSWRIVQAQADRQLGVFGGNLGWLWDLGALAIPAALTFFTFLLLYRGLPHRRTRLLHIWPGALIAALAFEVAKSGFAAYVARYTEYDLVYGSLGGVIALLFWVYLSANILLFGGEVASEIGFALRGEERKGQPMVAGMIEADWRRSLITLLRGLILAPPDDDRPVGRRGR